MWQILTDVWEESAASIFSINKACVLKGGTCRRGGRLEASIHYTVSLTPVDSLRTPSGPLLSAHGLLFYHVEETEENHEKPQLGCLWPGREVNHAPLLQEYSAVPLSYPARFVRLDWWLRKSALCPAGGRVAD